MYIKMFQIFSRELRLAKNDPGLINASGGSDKTLSGIGVKVAITIKNEQNKVISKLPGFTGGNVLINFKKCTLLRILVVVILNLQFLF